MATSPFKKLTSTGAGDVIKILPSGTVFLYQFLSPLLANSGECKPINEALALALVIICGLFCLFSSFTDSYVGPDGTVHWTTPWSANSSMPESVDSSVYNFGKGDIVHAVFSVAVFAVLVVTDSNMVQCFFPSLAVQQKALLQILPLAVGLVSSIVFYWFPNTRHGIGYRCTASTTGVTSYTLLG